MSTARRPSGGRSRRAIGPPFGSLVGSLRRTLRIARQAAPRPTAVALTSQVVAGVAATAQLLVGRALLDELLTGGEAGFRSSSVVVPVCVLVAVSSVAAYASILQSTAGMVLNECIGRYATGRFLDVAATVEPSAYEDPAFGELLERVRSTASSRSLMAVNGLLGSFGAVTSAVGVAMALAVIAPLLLPLAVVAVAPAWLAGTAASRRLHALVRSRSAADRRRSYLAHVLSHRDLAK